MEKFAWLTVAVLSRRLIAAVLIGIVLLGYDVRAVGGVVSGLKDPILRIYSHLVDDLMRTGFKGGLVMSRASVDAGDGREEVFELVIRIDFNSVDFGRRTELTTSYFGAEGDSFTRQLKRVKPEVAKAVAKDIVPGTVSFPIASDPVVGLLRVKRGILEEAQCPAMREIYQEFREHSLRIDLPSSPVGYSRWTAPVYGISASSQSGSVVGKFSGELPEAKWIRKSMERVERCIVP